ncbi:MAG: oxygenase MpaB family protein [Thermoleophilaceae bacterium]
MSDAGLFGPGSLTWRVNREGVLLLGGGAALTLQVAHPLVAAGVAEHSNYREDPWGRLYRTLDLTTKIVFGSTEVAEEASQRIKHVHGRVKGITKEDGGRYPAGTEYDARNPELLMWVHATLVRTSLDVYTRYVGPLSIAEQRGYYEEQKLLGEKFGIPRERQPEDYAAFNDYFAEMLASDRIAVTDALRDVVDATLRPEMPFVMRPVLEAVNVATVGLLPDRLRAELGLRWTPNRRRFFDASRVVLSAALPVLPRVMRDFPPARSADRRARRLAAA